ncbi:MAG: helix-turn-helix domain-containing protein [Oscillospiraceae bacterium]|nr:helix-turn-helix domain-containing protein [Oscillospiraceae bacterium]
MRRRKEKDPTRHNKAFKYRIYPNTEQEILLTKTFGCVRFIYNSELYISMKTYETTGQSNIISYGRL